ncbi:MAG: hypothetical protein R3301_16555, partial [Saprospiraceae bacterium]|nr:hypothetical protein [Saprospiraceae bacterium]
AADRPPDHDGTLIGGFKVSDLNDPDDDDDGINDTLDLFVWDPDNGTTTTLPLNYPLLNSNPGTGFYGLGFTGLMANLTDDYLDLWQNEDNSNTDIIAGGASGLLTYVNIDEGDALGGFNDQSNGFQFGVAVDSTTAPFEVKVTMVGPVFPDTIQDFQSAGMYAGTGDQDNYVKLVVNANGGTPNLLLVHESAGVATSTPFAAPGIGSTALIELVLVINPANGYVKAQYAMNGGARVHLGDGFFVDGALLTALKHDVAMGVGVISTARGSTNQFEATWSDISLQYNPVTNGEWFTLQDGFNCNPMGSPGSCCEPRHEAAYVQSGDKFYLMGGREHGSNVNIYDPATDTWTVGATPPFLMHHFQAVDYHGLILAAGAFTGTFPNEPSVDSIMVYDPVADAWYAGPEIPPGRRRGSAAAVLHNDTLFLAGGNTMGHQDGSVNWFDKYDVRNHTWTPLPNAPNRRDHFHAAVIDNQVVAAAGRRTGEGGSTWLATEATVDIFDITNQSWDTIAAPIPTERAGNTVAVLNGELLVIGGERLSGLANSETEALDIGSETWRTLDALNTGRHGTQAIVNNGGIYVASGSLIRGGSDLTNTRTTEAFYFFGPTEPILVPHTQSSLSASNLNFGQVDILDSAEADLRIDNTGGSQAILIQSVSLFDGTAYSIDTNLNFPRLVKPSDSLLLRLQFNPESVGMLEDTLYIQHTGANAPQTKVVLSGEGLFTWIGGQRAYVDSAATGSELGNTWANAFKELSSALDIASQYPQIGEIWIARGTYQPGSERTSTFEVVDSTALYGGFAGTETMLSERDIMTNPVILDGDIGIAGDSTDNIYHIITIPAAVDTALLDGVTIRGGTANGPVGNQQIGAGVFNLGSATLANCVIRQCGSILNGSAIFAHGNSSVLRLDAVMIENNSDPYIVNSVGSTIRWVNSSEVK